jgi:hypothetical protein
MGASTVASLGAIEPNVTCVVKIFPSHFFGHEGPGLAYSTRMSCAQCERTGVTGSSRKRLFVVAGLGALTVAGITMGLPGTQVPLKPAPPAASGVVHVVVNERGFFPSSVAIAPDTPVQLEFTRTTEETCATSVVFPELSITKDLPLREPVRISVPAERERTLAFQCGVGDHRSAVIIQ